MKAMPLLPLLLSGLALSCNAQAQEFYNTIPDVLAGNAALEQYKDKEADGAERTDAEAVDADDPEVVAIATAFNTCQARARREHAGGSPAQRAALQACDARLRAQVRALADSRDAQR